MKRLNNAAAFFTTAGMMAGLVAGAWASAPVALSSNAMLVPQQGACPTPSPAPDPSKLTWKHGADEYNAYLALGKAPDNATKAKLAADFLQKYPDSDYKNFVIQVEAGALAQANPAAAVDAAQTLIKAPGVTTDQLLTAYTIVAYVGIGLAQPNAADFQARNSELAEAGNCGLKLLSSAPAAQQAQVAPAFNKAEGFAALNNKNFADAITLLTKATTMNPKDPLPFYWLGVALVTQEKPDFNDGLFYLAKAAAIAPNEATYGNYLNTVYSNYHGSADGLADVKSAAAANATPPAGFTVKSSVDLQNAKNQADYQAALEAQKNQLPPPDSFAGIKARLQKPEMAESFWKTVKGQGFELDGIVNDIGVGGKSIDIAVGETDATKGTPSDLHVVLATPLTATKRPKKGDKVTVDGVAESYTGAPFMMNFNQGSVKGYSPEPPKGGGF